MEKIDNSRLTELCRELFFPFDSRFFRKDFCLGDNESEELKRIERLFILPEDISSYNEILPDPDLERKENKSTFHTITNLSRNDIGDNKNLPSDITPLSGTEKEILLIKATATSDKGVDQDGDSSTSVSIQPYENATNPKQENAITTLAAVCARINTQLDNLLSEVAFERNSLDCWLFFHRKITDLKSSVHPMAPEVLNSVTSQIESIVNSIDRKDSIWIYAEKAFYSLFGEITLSFDGGQITLTYPMTDVHRFSSIIVVIKEILQIQNNSVKTVYYTSLNTLKHLFDEEQNTSMLESQRSDPGDLCYYPRIMSVSTMNDPEEGHFLQGILSADAGHLHRYWWDNYDSIEPLVQQRYYNIEPFVFCKSFSDIKLKDDLSMWEIYGDRAEGCCCEVEIQCSTEYPLYNVAYLATNPSPENGSEYQIVQIGSEHNPIVSGSSLPGKFDLLSVSLALLRRYIDLVKEGINCGSFWHDGTIADIRKGIMEITYLFKDASYSHESEIRYLDSFPDHEDIKPVGGSIEKKQLPLLSVKSNVGFEYKEVILGPKVKHPDIAFAYLQYMFLKHKRTGDAPVITKSAIQYR